MAFIIDRQTINDLNIFGKVRGNSVYGVFNSTRTRGGAQLLEEMFHYPLSDAERINHRSTVIRYFIFSFQSCPQITPFPQISTQVTGKWCNM